jgi:hypothetical protein
MTGSHVGKNGHLDLTLSGWLGVSCAVSTLAVAEDTLAGLFEQLKKGVFPYPAPDGAYVAVVGIPAGIPVLTTNVVIRFQSSETPYLRAVHHVSLNPSFLALAPVDNLACVLGRLKNNVASSRAIQVRSECRA